MDSSSPTQSLIEQISSIDLPTTNGSLQPHVRQQLQGLVKKLSFALESPFETLNRLVVLVCREKHLQREVKRSLRKGDSHSSMLWSV